MTLSRIMQDKDTLTYYIQYRKWYWPLWRFIRDVDGRPQTYGLADAIDTLNRRISKIKPSRKVLRCIKEI